MPQKSLWLNYVLAAICFCSGMRLLQYYVGVRIEIYHVLVVIFLALFIGQSVFIEKFPGRIAAGMGTSLACMGTIVLISGFSFIFHNRALDPQATIQFVKGFIELAVLFFAFAALLVHLSRQRQETTRFLLRAYILGAAASAGYSVLEVIFASFGFDLGKFVFGSLSIYPPGFDRSAPFYFHWDIFFRAVGFAGIDAQANYCAGAIPLLLVGRPFRSPITNLALASICLFGCALTLSRNGFIFLAASFLICFALRPRSLIRNLPSVAIIAVPLMVTFAIFPKQFTILLSTRTPSLAIASSTPPHPPASSVVKALPPVTQTAPQATRSIPPSANSSAGHQKGRTVAEPAQIHRENNSEKSHGASRLSWITRGINRLGAGRIEIYRPVWADILDHPFGHGLNQFYVVIEKSDEIDLSVLQAKYSTWTKQHLRDDYANVHNSWLNILFDGGWPFFCAHLAYYISIVFACWRSQSVIGVAGICIIIPLILSGLGDMTLYLFNNELLMVLILAAVTTQAEASDRRL